jgi:2-C-methyl-D-erythritol 2,4-cyclodiphosphate synthase
VLGGVTVPFDRGLAGHSDADALIHAVIDAMLGAAGAGNIGMHFPDTDPAYKDADSVKLLEHTVAMLGEQNVHVQNIDVVVIAEQPKLGPYIDAMCQSVAAAVGVGANRVSVKPKTAEQMGPVGAGEGLAVMAVVLVDAPDNPDT